MKSLEVERVCDSSPGTIIELNVASMKVCRAAGLELTPILA